MLVTRYNPDVMCWLIDLMCLYTPWLQPRYAESLANRHVRPVFLLIDSAGLSSTIDRAMTNANMNKTVVTCAIYCIQFVAGVLK